MYNDLDAAKLRVLLADRDKKILDAYAELNRRREESATYFEEARTDFQTRLKNRRDAYEFMSGILRRRREGDRHAAVAILDLDDFKLVNDAIGHNAGDEVLTAVGKLIKRRLRPGDHGARWGGDEFVLTFDKTTEEEGQAIIVAIRKDLERYTFDFNALRTKEQAIHPSFTYGIAELDETVTTPEAFVNKADQRLLTFKEGRPPRGR